MPTLSPKHVVWIQTNREYQMFQKREAEASAKVDQMRIQIAQQEAYLDRLIEDPYLLEQVVRNKLGYTKPGEILFIFPDDDPVLEDVQQ